jgi:hypothetical protein
VTLRLRSEEQTRIVWLLALMVFMLGCRTIAARESSIANVFSANEQLMRRIDANDRDIAQAATLRRREQLARQDLFRISGEQRAALSLAEFLRRLAFIATRLQLTVMSVTPSAASPGVKSTRTALIPLPVTVLVRGKFRSLVHFVQEITRQKSLTGVEGVQIVISPVPAMRGLELDATIHLMLYRLLLNAVDAPAR